MNTTLYIFDIDGTLTDSVPMYLMSVTQAMQRMGIADIDTDYTHYKHHTDSYAFRYNYERNTTEPYNSELLVQLEEELLVQMNTFAPVSEILGAKALIDFMRAHAIPFCFATGALPKPAMQKLQQCDIWYDPALIATSKTHETRVGFVQEAIERAKSYYKQTDFEQIISVGDGLWDLKTAQALSLEFVGIGERHKEALLAHGATRCYTDIASFHREISTTL